MVGIILASHGNFAEGILHSATMIFGEQKNVCVVSLQPKEGPEQLQEKLKQAASSLNQKEILFLVDLWGGTPCNQANLLVEEHKDSWALVAGVNLPLLLETFALRETMSAKELANHLLEQAQQSVRGYPEDLVIPCKTKKKEVKTEAATGNGKIKYVLARIDSRLLHGQVVTSWVPTTHPNRILVVSDSVAHDGLRKKLIIQAAPSQVKVNVIPVSKMIEVSKDPRFGATKALVLFETVQDALRTIEGGADIKELNIGSMAHKEGKVAVNKVLSLDEADVKAFLALKEKGVHFDVRKVPNDTAENMEEYLAKATKLLKEHK